MPSEEDERGEREGNLILHDMNVRLEYNETQQSFHINTGDKEPNTYGYYTIDAGISEDEARSFINYIRTVYADMENSFQFVMEQWVNFEYV